MLEYYDLQSVPRSAVDVRLACLRLLTEQQVLSLAEIGRRVGVDRATVSRYKKLLEAKGVEFASKDGRERSGRRPQFEAAWKRIGELKSKFPGYGGTELWAYLIGEEGFCVDDLPSVSRISGWLSERGYCHKAITARSDDRAYHSEAADEPFRRVGMDEVYPFTNAKGQSVRVCNVRDWFSGAVYSEPFLMGRQVGLDGYRGVDPLAFAGVLLRFVEAFESPKVLVLDNGMGQVINSGWLPEVARHALNLGIVVEFEPYGRPWKNGAVERWHRDMLKWWAGVRRDIHTLDHSYRAIRGRALFVNEFWPRRQLGNKTVSQVVPWRKWSASQEGVSDIRVEPVGKLGLHRSGVIRLQREVETGGVVQLHGNDYIRVSQALVGSYVRCDFLVHPDGVPGEVSVFDGKGELVMVGRHFIECLRPEGSALVVDPVYHTYSMDVEPGGRAFDQDSHNRELERMAKRRRASGMYAATGSSSSMSVSSRKGKGV